MVALTEYTSYDEVRAVLGVSDDELGDDTLALGVYASALTMEFEDVDLGLVDYYDTVVEIPEDDRSAEQTRFYDATRMFSTYAVAQQLSSSLPLFAPKDITDGKAALGRFSDSPYRETIADIATKYGRYRNRLITAFAGLQPYAGTSVSLNIFTAVDLPFDPVTGS